MKSGIVYPCFSTDFLIEEADMDIVSIKERDLQCCFWDEKLNKAIRSVTRMMHLWDIKSMPKDDVIVHYFKDIAQMLMAVKNCKKE